MGSTHACFGVPIYYLAASPLDSREINLDLRGEVEIVGEDIDSVIDDNLGDLTNSLRCFLHRKFQMYFRRQIVGQSSCHSVNRDQLVKMKTVTSILANIRNHGKT